MAYKAENICYLALYRKSFLTTCLETESNDPSIDLLGNALEWPYGLIFKLWIIFLTYIMHMYIDVSFTFKNAELLM